ncbi:hypothetical protein CPJCM30710_00220 [Clostridium polyendosporum]|uniref:HlyD family secretion protein n=1 Tax=Clostridium polyendosporum TaxID=69208 RepID=A0A919RX23_9CLOT|nr:HlyD family efflux transporter periplasmic adaptor subunit [Clostridium polyendosporum]GIM27356.1 hypothetical protein CPJCM30710_00220 [Clostridium polyendosporum]
MKSKLIKRLITCLIIGTVAVGSYYGYKKYFSSKTAAATNQYITVTAKKMNMQVNIQGTGSAYVAISKDIVPNNTGVLKDLNVKVGDTVKAGAKLFTSDSDDLRLNVANAQNNLDRQKLTLSIDQSNYNDQVAKANAAVTDAQNKLNDAVKQVNKMIVTAPISGVIVAVNNKNGDNIQADSGQTGGSSYNTQVNKSSNNGQVNNNSDNARTVVLVIADPSSPQKKVEVVPNNNGVLKNLKVKIGDTVKVSQELFVSDSDQLRQNVTNAQKNLDKQKSALASAKNNNKIAIDTLAVKDAQSQLDDALQQMNKMTVTAPIDGLVALVNNSNGDKVDASSGGSSGQSSGSGGGGQGNSSSGNGQSSGNSTSGQLNSSGSNGRTSSSSGSTQSGVLSIVDLSSMKVKVAVDELDIAKVKEGQKAELRFDAIKDKVYDGTVESIAQIGTSTNNVTTYDVVIVITDPTNIKIGMNANVNILVDSKDNALTIPLEALVDRNGNKYVMIENSERNSLNTSNNSSDKANGGENNQNTSAQNGQSIRGNGQANRNGGNMQGYAGRGSTSTGKLVQVKTGLENENYVEIVDGITEGQKVLINLPTSTLGSNTNNRNSVSGGFSGVRSQGGNNVRNN